MHPLTSAPTARPQIKATIVSNEDDRRLAGKVVDGSTHHGPFRKLKGL
jgi:hypothetical protein